MDEPEAAAPKRAWRAWARSVRSSVDFDDASDAVVGHLVAWGPLQSAAAVLLFLPMPDEINLLPLMEARLACRFVATRTPEHGGTLVVHELGGPLEVHRLGFLQPHPSAPRVDPGDIDVMLMPGLAFSRTGVRLGRGGGYFDELLSRTPRSTLRVAVAPEAVVVDQLPSEPHDAVMDYLATENGVVEVVS